MQENSPLLKIITIFITLSIDLIKLFQRKTLLRLAFTKHLKMSTSLHTKDQNKNHHIKYSIGNKWHLTFHFYKIILKNNNDFLSKGSYMMILDIIYQINLMSEEDMVLNTQGWLPLSLETILTEKVWERQEIFMIYKGNKYLIF